jgi:hypothetical protein
MGDYDDSIKISDKASDCGCNICMHGFWFSEFSCFLIIFLVVILVGATGISTNGFQYSDSQTEFNYKYF